MKNFVALLVAVALITPAFAQNDAAKEIQMKQKIATVTPAIKPILLHTGKPITQNDKKQLLASVVKAYALKASGVKINGVGSPAATSATLTPMQMYQSGFVTTAATDIDEIFFDQPGSSIVFGAAPNGQLVFTIDVTPNTAYTLSFNVGSLRTTTFTVVSSGSGQNSETFTGSAGSNEFAYAFVSNSSGFVTVAISGNQTWFFSSCEIIANPLN